MTSLKTWKGLEILLAVEKRPQVIADTVRLTCEQENITLEQYLADLADITGGEK